MYFIHNRYDEESKKTLKNLDSGIVVVDYYADPDRYKRIKGLQKIPCFIEKLEFEEESIFVLNRKVQELSVEIDKIKHELTNVLDKQREQESMLIECFTDLDASLNGGDDNATAEPAVME